MFHLRYVLYLNLVKIRYYAFLCDSAGFLLRLFLIKL